MLDVLSGMDAATDKTSDSPASRGQHNEQSPQPEAGRAAVACSECGTTALAPNPSDGSRDSSGTADGSGPAADSPNWQGERKLIAQRKEAAGLPDEGTSDPDGSIVGLCLSGGGLRAATFALGFLQSLRRNGVMRYLDYVVSVSGGGYTNGYLATEINRYANLNEPGPNGQRQGDADGNPDTSYHDTAGDDGDLAVGDSAGRPRRDRDRFRDCGHYLRQPVEFLARYVPATAVSLAMFGSGLLAAACWIAIAYRLFDDSSVKAVVQIGFRETNELFYAFLPTVLLTIVWLIDYVSGAIRRRYRRLPEGGGKRWATAILALFAAVGCVHLAAVVRSVLGGTPIGLPWPNPGHAFPSSIAILLSLAGAVALVFVVGILIRAAGSQFKNWLEKVRGGDSAREEPQEEQPLIGTGGLIIGILLVALLASCAGLASFCCQLCSTVPWGGVENAYGDVVASGPLLPLSVWGFVILAVWVVRVRVGAERFNRFLLRLVIASVPLGFVVALTNGYMNVGSLDGLFASAGLPVTAQQAFRNPLTLFVLCCALAATQYKRLLRSQQPNATLGERLILRTVLFGLVVGIPLMIFGKVAQENVSGYATDRDAMLLRTDIKDAAGFGEWWNESNRQGDDPRAEGGRRNGSARAMFLSDAIQDATKQDGDENHEDPIRDLLAVYNTSVARREAYLYGDAGWERESRGFTATDHGTIPRLATMLHLPFGDHVGRARKAIAGEGVADAADSIGKIGDATKAIREAFVGSDDARPDGVERTPIREAVETQKREIGRLRAMMKPKGKDSEPKPFLSRQAERVIEDALAAQLSLSLKTPELTHQLGIVLAQRIKRENASHSDPTAPIDAERVLDYLDGTLLDEMESPHEPAEQRLLAEYVRRAVPETAVLMRDGGQQPAVHPANGAAEPASLFPTTQFRGGQDAPVDRYWLNPIDKRWRLAEFNRLLLERTYPRLFKARRLTSTPIVLPYDQATRYGMGLAATVVFLVLFLGCDVNRLSPMQHYYRDRLRRTFLMIDDKHQANLKLKKPGCSLPLSHLTGNVRVGGPLHLFVCSLRTSVELPVDRCDGNTNHKRKTMSFSTLFGGSPLAPNPQRRYLHNYVYSPAGVGSRATGFREYRPDECEDGCESPELAEAVTNSGAAVNPTAMAVGPLRWVLGAFNLRLGEWIPNPARGGRPARWFRRLLSRPTPAAILTETVRGWMAKGDRESGSEGRESSAWAHGSVSDGGFSDFLGLDELLIRRARVVIVVDCSVNVGSERFRAIGEAIRSIRTEHGHEIYDLDEETPLDLARLERDDDCLTPQHMLLGRIRYRDENRAADAAGSETGSPSAPRQEGLLVYVQMTRTGDEPADVEHYAHMVPSFPDHPTSDQILPPEMVESYRQLGNHIGDAVCAGVPKRTSRTGETGVPRFEDNKLSLTQGFLTTNELIAGLIESYRLDCREVRIDRRDDLRRLPSVLTKDRFGGPKWNTIETTLLRYADEPDYRHCVRSQLHGVVHCEWGINAEAGKPGFHAVAPSPPNINGRKAEKKKDNFDSEHLGAIILAAHDYCLSSGEGESMREHYVSRDADNFRVSDGRDLLLGGNRYQSGGRIALLSAAADFCSVIDRHTASTPDCKSTPDYQQSLTRLMIVLSDAVFRYRGRATAHMVLYYLIRSGRSGDVKKLPPEEPGMTRGVSPNGNSPSGTSGTRRDDQWVAQVERWFPDRSRCLDAFGENLFGKVMQIDTDLNEDGFSTRRMSALFRNSLQAIETRDDGESHPGTSANPSPTRAAEDPADGHRPEPDTPEADKRQFDSDVPVADPQPSGSETPSVGIQRDGGQVDLGQVDSDGA